MRLWTNYLEAKRCRRSTGALTRATIWAFGCALWAFSTLPGAAQAAERAAIVISVPGLRDERLPNATSDGRMVATALREMDFSTLLIEDPRAASLPEIPAAVQKHVAGSRLVILYVVGPALALRNENLLLAQDSGYRTEAQLRETGLPLDRLIDEISRETGRSAVAILDSSGVPAAVLRAFPTLTGVSSFPQRKDNLLVALANTPGAVSSRVENGENGVYATALVNTLRSANEGLFSSFKNIRRNVREATAGVLLPVIEGGLRSNEILRRPPPAEERVDERAPMLDQILWTFVRDSADETDFDVFAQIFPASGYRERVLGRRLRLASASQPGVGNLVRALSAPAAAAPTEPAALEQFSATTGDRAPPQPLRTWPRELPATTGGLANWATKCDELAADPDDPMRLTAGVRWDLVNRRAAIRACIAELVKDPSSRRIQFQLGRVLDIANQHSWADFFYRQAMERSYSAAVANLAYMYMTGRGRPADLPEAIRLLRVGADLGNLRTRTDLAESYLRGAGVPQSVPEAVLWLRLAGSMGWPNAIDILGNLHFQGRGVEKNLAWAVELYAAAAAVGNTNAMVNLGRAYLYGQGVERNLNRAREWLERSSAGGNPFAPFFLAELYTNGTGVAKDARRAVELYGIAAERGFGQARFELGQLYERPGAVARQPDRITAAFHYALADRQSYETPVSPEITQRARSRLAEIRRQLRPAEQAELDDRIKAWLELNGN